MKTPNTCELFLLGIGKLYELGKRGTSSDRKQQLQVTRTASKHYSLNTSAHFNLPVPWTHTMFPVEVKRSVL